VGGLLGPDPVLLDLAIEALPVDAEEACRFLLVAAAALQCSDDVALLEFCER
jgi:hypothetical protein